MGTQLKGQTYREALAHTRTRREPTTMQAGSLVFWNWLEYSENSRQIEA